MRCIRCNKRPAVVFVSENTSGKSTKGYCMKCAKEIGIKPVTNLIEQMGISDEEFEQMQDQMAELMETGVLGDEGMEFVDDGDENFSAGGTPTFPPFFQNLFSMSKPSDSLEDRGVTGSSGGSTAKGGTGSYGGDEKKQTGRRDDRRKDGKKPKRKHLESYGANLTQRARDGGIDAVIGRQKEIDRVIQILSRRTKNNPCLIGEPGVGKTAVAEGIALKIAAGDVPFRLKNKELYLLDMTALVAGTQFRGQFESRIKGLIDEVKADGNIILFIDEVHSLIGTGDSEGSMNAANIMKPALSRGEIQVIGATTFAEYRKYIEKDSALERRFQPVTIDEPSIDETIDVLSGIKSYYETYHRVTLSDDLVRKIVVLSERYITDRYLPDKAIDLLDEACTYAALRNKKLEDYDMDVQRMNELKEQEDELSSAENIDYEKLAKLRYDKVCLDKKIEDLKGQSLEAAVKESDVAHVIELWTGIPATKIQENELSKLACLEQTLNKKVIGQEEGVKALAAAVRRSRVRISPRHRPASFIFVGPTGVGKTELVKVLAQELFDMPETLIRLDMSEYMEKHSVSKIIGSPPGYVGYEEAGQVTEKVRRRPYSVLLFDEIEKAHPDVLNILLQILDEGTLTDAQGRKVNFANTVIVMTSNAGSEKRENALGFGKSEIQASEEKAKKALSEFLRPEFLSRLDEIIVFRSLNEEDYVKIANLMLGEYIGTLAEKNIKFTYDEKAQRFLAQKSFGGKSGARDLRNMIRREVEDKIASALISAQNDLSAVHLTADDNGLILDTL